MPMTPETLAALLIQLETQHVAIASEWKRLAIQTRRTRVKLLSLQSAVSALANAVASDIQNARFEPGLSKTCYSAGEQMGQTIRRIDAEAAEEAATAGSLTIDGPLTSKELIDATDEWRRRIAALNAKA